MSDGLRDEYDDIIGNYDSVEEMCNDLALNFDDVYDYSDLERQDDED